MEINEDILYPFLIYNDPIRYTKNVTLYPVKMENIFEFQQYVQSITIRKDSIFPVKNILKMTYLDFLFYCHNNLELSEEYKLNFLPYWYQWAHKLLMLVCKDQEVLIGTGQALFSINGEIITPEKFDDLRRIIIIQNDVDFDIDEFINYDTEQELIKAQNTLSKEKATIEDYIDAYAVVMKASDSEIKNLTIRKFWRHIKRINMHENYTISKISSMSGMVTFKNPIQHWMVQIEKDDRYSSVKTSEQELENKVG